MDECWWEPKVFEGVDLDEDTVGFRERMVIMETQITLVWHRVVQRLLGGVAEYYCEKERY